jgi:pimeloyl-ACP methyl ester carboxylesterase
MKIIGGSGMAFATTVIGDIHYESFGLAGDPAVLLLGGAGRQAIDYDDEFCTALISRGFRAIRFDTRDTGPSAGMGAAPSNLEAVYRGALAGEPAPAAYSLADLARDALAVMEAAGVARAHLVGRSLGSAVAQTLALGQPERVLSLTLIMANSRSVASDLPEATVARVAAESLADVDDFVARQVRVAKAAALPQDFDPDRVAEEARTMWRRGVHPGGVARHFAAALGMSDLRGALGGLNVPTLVIHGALDRTIAPSYARETADAISGARLEMLEDMSHDGSPRVRARWLPLILHHLAGA